MLDIELEAEAERRIFAVPKLDHTGDADEVDARAEVEIADDRRSGQD